MTPFAMTPFAQRANKKKKKTTKKMIMANEFALVDDQICLPFSDPCIGQLYLE
jgi:hypothetical protein